MLNQSRASISPLSKELVRFDLSLPPRSPPGPPADEACLARNSLELFHSIALYSGNRSKRRAVSVAGGFPLRHTKLPEKPEPLTGFTSFLATLLDCESRCRPWLETAPPCSRSAWPLDTRLPCPANATPPVQGLFPRRRQLRRVAPTPPLYSMGCLHLWKSPGPDGLYIEFRSVTTDFL